MARINSLRRGCRDVWNAFLVAGVRFAGIFDFPVIAPCYEVPKRLIPFSRVLSAKGFKQWVHFYEDDFLFEKIWRNPNKYLDVLKRFEGVILPDFSVYRDMPFVMQLWNIYRSRAIGAWLQKEGIKVIANIRFGDRRTWRLSCDGAPRCCTIAVGTLGAIKVVEDRNQLIQGLDAIVKTLKPSVIVVYGSAPSSIFKQYQDRGIRIVQFESETALRFRAVK